MKFISKSSNLLIVLRPGLQAQPITGTPAKATVSVRFKDGVADVPEGELTDMMLRHSGFNYDFISAEDVNFDPYGTMRQPAEPTHVMTELKFGNAVGRKISEGKQVLPADIQKMINDAAMKMASEMLPGMVEKTIQGILATRESQNPKESAPAKGKLKGKPGRKGKKPSFEKKIVDVPTPYAEVTPPEEEPEEEVETNAVVDAS